MLNPFKRQNHFLTQAGAITGFVAAFFESPIDFFKSQIQVQIIRSKQDPNYKRAFPSQCVFCFAICPEAQTLQKRCLLLHRSVALCTGFTDLHLTALKANTGTKAAPLPCLKDAVSPQK